MRNVTLKMIDIFTEQEVVRTIDATNAYSNGGFGWMLQGEDEQRQNLENWISERANDQHDTTLDLISWEFEPTA